MSSGGPDSAEQDGAKRPGVARRKARLPIKQHKWREGEDPDTMPSIFKNGYEKFWEDARRRKEGKGHEDKVKRTVQKAKEDAEREDNQQEGGGRRSEGPSGQDGESSRRGRGAGRHRRRYPDRRAAGSDDGGEGRGAAGSDRGGDQEIRVRRTGESREYEKGAYARWYKAFMERENKVSEKYQIIMGKPDKGVTDLDVQNFKSCVNDMSIVMKNISEDYAAIFFSSLPGGIDDYYIRKYLYEGIMNHMRMYVLKEDVMKKLVDETSRLYREKLKAPKSQEAEVSPVTEPVPAPEPEPGARSSDSGPRRSPPPPQVYRTRRSRVTRPRPISPERRGGDGDSEGGRAQLVPRSDDLSPAEEEEPSEPQSKRMDRFRAKGKEMWDRVRNASRKAREYRPFSANPAGALTGATPHTPRIRARAARRLEKMGYYKAEGSFLATPFSLDVLPVLESATSVHGGQPAAQVAAEQQAEGHRRVPVPPVGAGDL
jgi:hypothetical protein